MKRYPKPNGEVMKSPEAYDICRFLEREDFEESDKSVVYVSSNGCYDVHVRPDGEWLAHERLGTECKQGSGLQELIEFFAAQDAGEA